MEDYIILGGVEFLSVHASTVAKILDLIVGNVNDKGLLSTLPVIDILIQVLDKYAGEVDNKLMDYFGLFVCMCVVLICCWTVRHAESVQPVKY